MLAAEVVMDGAVVAAEKGIVVGNLRFRDSGDMIDCAAMGTGGKGIPSSIERVRLHKPPVV